MTLISVLLLLAIGLALAYWLSMALASVRVGKSPALRDPGHRFIITLPAHDEDSVIAHTVERLLALDYPRDLFSVHIVADHCSDETADRARQAGAVVHERDSGPRTGKGAALSWLFQRLLSDDSCDAVIVFDADTQVAADFLRIMDAHLAQGEQVIQGQHIISNPDAGWFPALTWAMFLVDNRFQNLGRVNLGASAKHMGDSICFRADVLRQMGWGEGLTEDYQLRQKLLLRGITITYEAAAKGYGEAAPTWLQAKAQRARWLRGTYDAGQQYAGQLLREGIQQRNWALLDGALQVYLPAYSTLTLLSGGLLALQLLVNTLAGPIFPPGLIAAWFAVVVVLFVYPLFGLMLEHAPPKAYLAILSGPLFILWRTWLAVKSRYGQKQVGWVRTAHGAEAQNDKA